MRTARAAEEHPLMRGAAGAQSCHAPLAPPSDSGSLRGGTGPGEREAGSPSREAPSRARTVRQRMFSAGAWAPHCGGDLFNPVALHSALIESYLRLCGLQPCVVQIDTHTHIHCWTNVPVARAPSLFWGPRAQEAAPGPRAQQSVLLLHGFGASAIWQWLHQVRALGAAGFLVVMPDLVFFGGSWSSSPDRSIGFQAECMRQLMHHLGVPTYHVNGISYGGFVAYRLASMEPRRVQSLTLTNSGLLTTRAELDAMLQRWNVQSTAELLLPVDTAGVQRLMDLAYHHPPTPPHWVLQKTLPVLFQSMVQEKRELLEYLNVALAQGTEECKKLDMDVLILWGREDQVFPVAIAKRMETLFGDTSRLVVFEGASHMSNTEQSAQYNTELLAFLNKACFPSTVAPYDCLLGCLQIKALW